jgi:hypothetical protein
MTEDGASKALCDYLEMLAANAVLIDPSREHLAGVWLSFQEMPRPLGAYATVDFVADRDLTEFDDESYSEIEIAGEDRVVLCKSRGVEWLFKINVYASRPIDWCRLFSAGLRSRESSVWMAPLVVRDVRPVQRVPALVQAEWEGRASFDVALAAVATEPLLVDVIETGEIITSGEGGSTVVAGFTFQKT